MSGALISVFANQRQFATVPGAPTIGTATAVTYSSATVAFTAPASNGGSAITSYTATSSPGGITGTLSQSGSGTITVSGLSGSTSYTFTVTATNAVGTSAASSASNSITTPVAPPTTIGQAYGGGYYGGKIDVSGTQYYLIVADITVGQVYAKQWATTDTTTGITSVINGPSNSASLSALGSGYEAARFCENLNTGGYTDWYLPAKNELATIYYFLKPSTDLNNTASGSTANAVSPQPVSTNYTSGSPAQTSATSFMNGASSQEFSITGGSNGGYWTSTENGFNTGWRQAFKNGDQDYYGKNTVEFYTRAIRRIAV